MMEEMIFNLADTHLFFNDLEVSMQCCISQLLGILAYIQPGVGLLSLIEMCVYMTVDALRSQKA